MSHVEKFKHIQQFCFADLQKEVVYLLATTEKESDKPVVAIHHKGFNEYWEFNPAMLRAIDKVWDQFQTTAETLALPDNWEGV